MRLYEFVDSNQQLLDIIKPILLRAKADGATEVNTVQLINDIGDDSVTPEILMSILHTNRNNLKNIISRATPDSISLASADVKSMTSDYDLDVAKMKTTALNKAKGNLK